MRYEHVQKAPLYLILGAVASAMFVAAWQTPQQVVQLVLLGSGGLVFLLALSFRELTVRDEGDCLLVSFGPLPLFRRRVKYSDIESVAPGRTTILEGWGIHLSPGGGWVWNLWGFSCVDLLLTRQRRLRIGTDDVAGLERFLKQRVGQVESSNPPSAPS